MYPPLLFGKKIEKNKPNSWPLPSGINPLPTHPPQKNFTATVNTCSHPKPLRLNTVREVGTKANTRVYRQNKGAEDRWSLDKIDRCWGRAHIPLAQNLKMWRKKRTTRSPLLESPSLRGGQSPMISKANLGQQLTLGWGGGLMHTQLSTSLPIPGKVTP